MRISRTLPPAATPITFTDIVSGIRGLVRGPRARRNFCDELKAFYNVRYCFAFSSGKAALTVLLKALHEINPEKNTVLIPAFTCYSVPAAILKAGLKVALCDIDAKNLDFDFHELEKKIKTCYDAGVKESLLAVVPTHMLGIPADVERVKDLRGDQEIFIVEDAAQAMGGGETGKKNGALGDVGFFSLGRGKALSTVEGGIILTNNVAIGESIARQMKNISDYTLLGTLKLILYALVLSVFMHPFLFWIPRGIPFLKLGETLFERDFSINKLSTFQAGLAANWTKRLRRMADLRRRNAKALDQAFQGKTDPAFSLVPLDGDPALLRYPMKISDDTKRASLISAAERRGLGITGSYPEAIHHIDALEAAFNGRIYPNAERTAKQLVTMPVHSFVTLQDRRQIRKLIEHTLSWTDGAL